MIAPIGTPILLPNHLRRCWSIVAINTPLRVCAVPSNANVLSPPSVPIQCPAVVEFNPSPEKRRVAAAADKMKVFRSRHSCSSRQGPSPNGILLGDSHVARQGVRRWSTKKAVCAPSISWTGDGNSREWVFIVAWFSVPWCPNTWHIDFSFPTCININIGTVAKITLCCCPNDAHTARYRNNAVCGRATQIRSWAGSLHFNDNKTIKMVLLMGRKEGSSTFRLYDYIPERTIF